MNGVPANFHVENYLFEVTDNRRENSRLTEKSSKNLGYRLTGV